MRNLSATDLRLLRRVEAAGDAGLLHEINFEPAWLGGFVERGLVWQEIANGGRFKFTLSPAGMAVLLSPEQPDKGNVDA